MSEEDNILCYDNTKKSKPSVLNNYSIIDETYLDKFNKEQLQNKLQEKDKPKGKNENNSNYSNQTSADLFISVCYPNNNLSQVTSSKICFKNDKKQKKNIIIRDQQSELSSDYSIVSDNKNYEIKFEKIEEIDNWTEISEYSLEIQTIKSKLFKFHGNYLEKYSILELQPKIDNYYRNDGSNLNNNSNNYNQSKIAVLHYQDIISTFLNFDFKNDNKNNIQAPFLEHLLTTKKAKSLLERTKQLIPFGNNRISYVNNLIEGLGNSNYVFISNLNKIITSIKNKENKDLSKLDDDRIITFYNVILILSSMKLIGEKLLSAYKSIVKASKFGIKNDLNLNQTLKIENLQNNTENKKERKKSDESSDEDENYNIPLNLVYSNKSNDQVKHYKKFIKQLALYYTITEKNSFLILILKEVFNISIQEKLPSTLGDTNEINISMGTYIKKSMLKMSSYLVNKVSGYFESTVDVRKLSMVVLASLTAGQFQVQNLLLGNFSALVPIGSIVMSKLFGVFSNYLGKSSEEVNVSYFNKALDELIFHQKSTYDGLYKLTTTLLLFEIEKRSFKKEVIIKEIKLIQDQLREFLKSSHGLEEYISKNNKIESYSIVVDSDDWQKVVKEFDN